MNDDFVDQDSLQRLLKEARSANKADQELADAMSELIASEAWSMYMSRVLGPKIVSHGELLLQPAGGMDGMVRSEFLKGALYGLCLARDMPSVIVVAMREVRSPQENDDDA